jgi:hypothetical protein
MPASTVAPEANQIQVLPAVPGLVLRGELDLALRRELASAVASLSKHVRDHVHLWLGDLRFIDVGCTAEVMKLHRTTATIAIHDAPPVFERIVRTGWPGHAFLLS